MDVDAVRAAARLRTDGVVSAVLRRFLRRQALRDERCVAGYVARADSPIASKLVLRRLSVYVCKVPLRSLTRDAALIFAAALACAFATGCSRTGNRGSAGSERLRVAININPTQLNPILAQNTIETFTDSLFFNL